MYLGKDEEIIGIAQASSYDQLRQTCTVIVYYKDGCERVTTATRELMEDLRPSLRRPPINTLVEVFEEEADGTGLG